MFRFIDLFAGIGGFRKGFESIGGECVFTCEYNKFAVQTYQANFNCDHPFASDITQVKEEDIPEHDVLLAGFPCQPFSLAGVSKKNSLGRSHGFADETQGTLFFDVARILRHHKPKAFVLENVKNLVSHDKGNTFKVIKAVLEELGYHISYRIIDGKGYTPQHRERIFIVGFKEDNQFDLNKLTFADPLSGPKMKTILHPENGSETAENPYTEHFLAKVNPKYTLTATYWQYLQNYAEKHRQKGNGFGYGLVGPEDVAKTMTARYYKDGSEILVDQPQIGIPRKLTPRECARLMGFDSPNEKPMTIPVSDTQAYKQFGNTVVVPVIKHIAEYMKPFL